MCAPGRETKENEATTYAVDGRACLPSGKASRCSSERKEARRRWHIWTMRMQGEPPGWATVYHPPRSFHEQNKWNFMFFSFTCEGCANNPASAGIGRGNPRHVPRRGQPYALPQRLPQSFNQNGRTQHWARSARCLSAINPVNFKICCVGWRTTRPERINISTPRSAKQEAGRHR